MSLPTRTAIIALAAASVPAGPATAAPGPPLREAPADLAASLECSAGVAQAQRPPVILVHGTTSSPEDSFSWGYRKVLPELGYPACTVRLPERATVDLQRSAEYVVHAVREVAGRAGRKVAVLGHSQGAFHAVFTQKFWPDLPGLVDDVVALSGPFKEAEGAQAGCNAASCSPPFRQRQTGARFFGAFLAAPLPAGPSFTSVLTLQDEVTRPQPESSTLAGPPGTDVRTITLQDVCPGRRTEHLGMVGDAVVFQLVIDALTHAGTADPARIVPECGKDRFDGIDEAGYAASVPSAAANLVTAGATADQSPDEPPVRCYLDPACGSVAERGALLAAARRRGRRLILRVQAPGQVRVGHRRPRIVAPGRRVIRVRRRGRVRIATRPAFYTRFLVERRL